MELIDLGRKKNKQGHSSINTERVSKKFRKDFNKFHEGDKESVDKTLTFLKDKNKDKKQAGELDFFFASACESTKRLPRHLQLKVKVEVMKAVINAETECLDHEQFRSPTPSINCEIAGCSSRTTPSPARQTSTPLPARQTSTPSPARQTSTPLPARQTSTHSPARQTSTPSPARQTSTPSPVTPFYPSTGQNQKVLQT